MRSALLFLYLGCLFLLPLRIKRREALRIRQMEEFLSLLTRIRREVACFSRPLPEICRADDLPALEKAGFFDRDPGTDLSAAFRRASPALSLSPDATALLDAFFSRAGSPLKAEEIGACDHAIGRLDELLAREKQDGAARVKLHSTLITTGGLLFLLLVV